MLPSLDELIERHPIEQYALAKPDDRKSPRAGPRPYHARGDTEVSRRLHDREKPLRDGCNEDLVLFHARTVESPQLVGLVGENPGLFRIFPSFVKPSEATLERGICEVFPDANPRQLAKWVRQTQASARIDVEPLLFSALICGAHFRITHPELASIQDAVRAWLTQQKLGSDVADLLLKVWTPGLTRELVRRGWQRGRQGPYIREKGRPPTARGAWVVALLVDDFLTQFGAKKTAECATALALLLLGRDFRGRASPGEVGDLSDFYKFRQKVTTTAVRQITEKIVDAYDFLLQQDGVRAGDLPASACGAAQWWARHKTLGVILQEFTPIGVAEWMLQLKIPDNLWEAFWAAET